NLIPVHSLIQFHGSPPYFVREPISALGLGPGLPGRANGADRAIKWLVGKSTGSDGRHEDQCGPVEPNHQASKPERRRLAPPGWRQRSWSRRLWRLPAYALVD